jgi:hypothetical protein
MREQSFGLHTFFFVLALVLFLIAGVTWFVPEPWPWRERVIALGLFFWALSTAIAF